MTKFQRGAIALYTQVFCNEFKGDKEAKLSGSGRYNRIRTQAGYEVALFKIDVIAYDQIKLIDDITKQMFYSDRPQGQKLEITSEDDRYRTINIYDRFPSFIRGQDGSSYWFEAKPEGWNRIKVLDRHFDREYIYTIE